MMAVLTVLAFGTAVLSSTFGMAGGLVLMGVYSLVLPVPEAMVLHGLTQLVANGARAAIWWRFVAVRALLGYAAGALIVGALFSLTAWVPPVRLVWLSLGVLPFVALAIPKAWAPDGMRPIPSVLAGGLVNAAQLVAGAAGPLLDLFFVRSDADRHAIVATKAATQTLGHLAKVAVYGALVADAPSIAQLSLPTMLGAAAGTVVGARLLERVSEAQFRRWGAVLVRGIGVVYLFKAWMG